MRKTLSPAQGPLRGAVRVPGDKSIGHRSLLLGSLAEGGLRVYGLPQGQDLKSTRRCLLGLGAKITDEDGCTTVGGAEDIWKAPQGPLDCGNSGTSMRLLMGLLAGRNFDTTLAGDASLSKRPMNRVAEPLTEMGGRFELSGGRFAPLTVKQGPRLKGLRQRLKVPSAQVKSAILLAGLSAEGETVLEDPYATRDHSERMLAWLAPELIRRDGAVIHLKPGLLKGGRTIHLPGDPSSAAFFSAAAAMVPGSQLAVEGVGLNPGRLGFFKVLLEMGSKTEIEALGEEAGEPVGRLRTRWAPLKAVRVAAERMPSLIDEVPLLAVVAASASGTTRLEGLAELRHKESDRLEGTARNLRAMGAQVRVDDDALEITGPAKLRGAAIETLADHRLALAFSIAALAAEGETTLSDAACADVSFPGFYENLAELLP